jgi:hypothetical protein
MIHRLSGVSRGRHGLPDWLRSSGGAFLYWVIFLLALEPANVLHARSMGHSLELDVEALRICVAALLACSTAPLSMGLARRFPLRGARHRRGFAVHGLAAAVLSFVLILTSCVLAAWLLQGQAVPAMADIRSQLAANWLLLTFALCAFIALAQALRPARDGEPAADASARRPTPALPRATTAPVSTPAPLLAVGHVSPPAAAHDPPRAVEPARSPATAPVPSPAAARAPPPAIAPVPSPAAALTPPLAIAPALRPALAPPPALAPAPTPASTIAIKSRGRLGYLDLATIEWVEAQGNYLALHAGGRSHLIRATLRSFAGRLDPGRYLRVHRRTIVAVDRIREIQPLANGDSTLILHDGQAIRASRSHRDVVRTRWAEFMARPGAMATRR